jgi:uncharacterized membrane protein YkvA (DUF1232 family)
MGEKFKVTFTLDDEDAEYFRALYRKVKKEAATHDSQKIITDAREIVQRARASKKTPPFVHEAIGVLADLVDLIQDEDYAAPQRVRNEVLAGLAYFSAAEDLIPDQVPGVGFLDDAIMVKFIEDEFKHELWGYRRFRKLRDSSEQRPWSSPASDRLRERLEADRRRVRGEIEERAAKEASKKKSGRPFGW